MASQRSLAADIVAALRNDRKAPYQTIADRVAATGHHQWNGDVNYVRNLASRHNLLRGRKHGQGQVRLLNPPTELPTDWYNGMDDPVPLSSDDWSDNPRNRVRPAGSLRTADELLDEMYAIGEIGGATQSPFVLGGGVVLAPHTGYCVALAGSDYRPPVALLQHRDQPDLTSATAVDEFRAWHEAMTPHLVQGHVWISMWRDDASGELAINITVVLDDRKAAMVLARHEDQQSIYHLDTEETIQAEGTGGPGWVPQPPSTVHVPKSEEIEKMLL